MASWTDVYDGKYPDSEDCLTINKTHTVVYATAEEGSSTFQVDAAAMKTLLEHNAQEMQVTCNRRTRVIERERGNQFVCSWQGQPETKVTKTLAKEKDLSR